MAVNSRFHTLERMSALHREWGSLTLRRVMSAHSDKMPSACLEVLIEKLSDIETSLPALYCNETLLISKLLNAVRDVEDCLLAYHKPVDTGQGVISDLHASLPTL